LCFFVVVALVQGFQPPHAVQSRNGLTALNAAKKGTKTVAKKAPAKKAAKKVVAKKAAKKVVAKKAAAKKVAPKGAKKPVAKKVAAKKVVAKSKFSPKSPKKTKLTLNKKGPEIKVDLPRNSGEVFKFENELGVQQPLGYWDPLGLVSDGDQEKFERLRYVEIKHGRISMLAVLGYLTTEAGVRLPGAIDLSGTQFSDIPGGFGAIETISGKGLAQLFLTVGWLEIFVMKDITGGEFPGDFRNGAIDYGWDTFSEEKKLQKRAIELNNGRAAMMGILALMVHEQLGVSILP